MNDQRKSNERDAWLIQECIAGRPLPIESKIVAALDEAHAVLCQLQKDLPDSPLTATIIAATTMLEVTAQEHFIILRTNRTKRNAR